MAAEEPNTTSAAAEIHHNDHSSADLEHVTDSEKLDGEKEVKTANTENVENPVQTAYIPESDEDYVVTFKTWVVVGILSASYGISFWIVPALSACAVVVATELGDPTASAWYISIYLVTITIAFMICGGKDSSLATSERQ